MFTNYYLGKKFDGWKVVSYVNTPSRHKIYTLEKKNLFCKRTVELRDNVLTDLRKGIITMKELVD